mgnify:CR=1 FL=1
MVNSSAFPRAIGRSVTLGVPVVVVALSVGLGAVLCTETSMLGRRGCGVRWEVRLVSLLCRVLVPLATRAKFVFIARAPLSFVLKIGALSSRASLIFGFLPREAWFVRAGAGEILLEDTRPRTRTVIAGTESVVGVNVSP